MSECTDMHPPGGPRRSVRRGRAALTLASSNPDTVVALQAGEPGGDDPDRDAVEDLFENGAVAMHLIGPDGTILKANRAACDLLKVTRAEYVGHGIAAFHEDALVAEDMLARLRTGAAIDKLPARLVAKDGSVRDVLISASARLENGRFLYARGVIIDVTGWSAPFDKDAAAQARLRDERLSKTYEAAAVGLSEADPEGRLLRVNATVCAITGYSAAELIGMSFFDLTADDDREKDLEFYRRHIAGDIETYRFEKRIRRRDGVHVWVSVRSTLVRDEKGGPLYTVRAMQDISRRKIVEQRLRDSERQMRELLESLPVAVFTTDAEGFVTFFNKAAEKLTGRTSQIGTDRWSIVQQYYQPDGTPLPFEDLPVVATLREGRGIRGIELVAERPDGTRIPVVPFPTPLFGEDGTVTGAINVLIDLSERKQAEANQRIMLKELNHRVKNNLQMLYSLLRSAERETENVEARAALAEATHRVGAIAAAQRVLYDVGSDLNFSADKFIDVVCSSARQTMGKAVQIEVVEVADVQLPNDAAMPLALIMNELLTNAAKYGFIGSGPAQVKVSLVRREGGLCLTVEDRGPGFQLQNVRRRASGLGLVSGLARQLGGTFEVENDQGARCIVCFAPRGTMH